MPPDILPKKIGSIGRGIPGVELSLLNSDNKKIKPGETGEIVAKGDNIMLGYLDDPKLTANTIKNG